jgi:hypothetical protein
MDHRPASKERKNKTHGENRGSKRKKNYTQPRRGRERTQSNNLHWKAKSLGISYRNPHPCKERARTGRPAKHSGEVVKLRHTDMCSLMMRHLVRVDLRANRSTRPKPVVAPSFPRAPPRPLSLGAYASGSSSTYPDILNLLQR